MLQNVSELMRETGMTPTTKSALEKLITNSKFHKRDMKKIENMILNDIQKEVQHAMDLYLLERCFAQINTE